VPAEGAQPEQIAEPPARGRGDHHRAGLGQSLQARGQVRRLADHRLLLRGAFANQVADHDEPGGDADPNLQRVGGGDAAHRLDHREAGPHRALGIVFVGARKAEINEHTVAHVFGDEPVEAAHRRRNAAVIGADHLAQFFGIEPRRQRRRTDQVAEHHRQLAPLRGRPGCGVRRRDVGSGGRPAAQGGDRVEQQAAVADHADAQILKVFRRQLRQHPHIDAVVFECGRVVLETKRPQPLGDIHDRLPRRRTAS